MSEKGKTPQERKQDKPWTRAHLDEEEIVALEKFRKKISATGYSTRMDGQEEAWMAGFQYAMQRSAKFVGEALKKAAEEFEELGKRE